MTGLLWHGDPHWGVLSCFRRNNIPFSEDDENRLRNLLPRFIRAIDLQRHLEKLTHERDTAYRALDSFSLGVILTLEEGTIVHANEPAKEFLAEGDAIRAVDNRLALQDGADSQLVEYLKKQISRAAKLSTSHSSSNIATFQVPRHEGNFIWLSLAPLNNTPETFGGFLDLEVRQPTATVFILDPSRTPGLSPETLTIRFGLTSAESNLAVALANGASLQEAAALAGRSEATFRKHLQSIFTKTSTHRQSELVSLLLRRVA
jgi:DNA-binding CsgD family transcriptional regulator